MEIIRHKNNVGIEILILLVIMSTELLLAVYRYPVVFFSSCSLLLLTLLFLHFRRLKILIDKKFIAIDFTILNIPYKKIRISFDRVTVSSSVFEPLAFYKDADIILEFAYYDDPGHPTVEIGIVEIRYKGKVISIDNEKTSYQLFLKIREAVLRQT